VTHWESALVAALIGAVAAVERKGAFQLMLARPLPLAFLTGWAVGDPMGGLLVGIPMELLFMGAVNLGAALPPQESLAASGVAAVAALASAEPAAPGSAALAILVLVPLAVAGRAGERLIEDANTLIASRVEARVAAGHPGAVWWNVAGVIVPFAGAFAVTFVVAAAAPLFGKAWNALPAAGRDGLDGAWYGLVAVGAASSLRSVRWHRAPLVGATAFAGVLVASLLVWRLS
jgi:PTS system mannose-specific IIC component